MAHAALHLCADVLVNAMTERPIKNLSVRPRLVRGKDGCFRRVTDAPEHARSSRSMRIEDRELAAAMTERLRRVIAEDQRDLTGAICGDPPVGYSALDRRVGEGRGQAA